jgi:RNA polymerase sigma factor (sigma-70 family)
MSVLGGGRVVGRFLTDGDSERFNVLYAEHAPRLRRRLKIKWRLPDYLAQDVVQDTFLHGARSLHQLQDEEKAGAWLTTIADRQAMVVHRRFLAPARHEVLAGDAEEVESKARVPVTADHAGTVVDAMVLSKAIEALPERLREVLTLHYLEGLSFAEIGHVMHCNQSTAHHLLASARHRLLRQLGGFESPRPPEPRPLKLETQVQQAMRRLPARRREVLERHVFRKMKPTKIAADLDITPGCARVHLHLAYKELASLLGVPDYRTVISQLKPF